MSSLSTSTTRYTAMPIAKIFNLGKALEEQEVLPEDRRRASGFKPALSLVTRPLPSRLSTWLSGAWQQWSIKH
ncbi:hypothetical protein CgunFtcFv8_001434 [Champsocephalus gunnari]|uniref:Uncharacterized protein n=1 Tax=Champsocephalus gunnari TaxID=52237 RepID=A0AAN8CKM7_CHAGU|nr:hypothetical protein CgunFtcFv8_001434 [Champsocephalus gunnari]